jgi:hypothetical protein
MKKWSPALMLVLVSSLCHGESFCGTAPYVPFDQVVQDKALMIGRRVRTHVVVTTDAKEYTLYRENERSLSGLLETTDDESLIYARANAPSQSTGVNVREDLLRKLQEAEGDNFKPDLTMIRYYRQDMALCGRVTKDDSGFRFAVDDGILERTYLLPLPKKQAAL